MLRFTHKELSLQILNKIAKIKKEGIFKKSIKNIKNFTRKIKGFIKSKINHAKPIKLGKNKKDEEKNKMPEMLNGAGQSDKEAGKAFLPLNLQHLLRLKTQKIPLSEKAGQIDADGNGLSKHCGNGGN